MNPNKEKRFVQKGGGDWGFDKVEFIQRQQLICGWIHLFYTPWIEMEGKPEIKINPELQNKNR